MWAASVAERSPRRVRDARDTVAAFIKLSSRYTSCSDSPGVSPAEYHTQTTILAHGTKEQRLSNKCREHTLCFWDPVTGKLYIALTMYSSYLFICDQTKNGQDCYNLHLSSITPYFKSFMWENSLDIVYNNDKGPEPANAGEKSLIHASHPNRLSSCDNLISDFSDDSDFL